MITSTSNPQVKFLRSLHLAKHRSESGLFLVEGLKLVGQAFDSNAEIQQIIISPEWLISDYGKSLVDLAIKKHIDILELSTNAFESIARKDKPQGIAALAKQNLRDINTLNLNDEKQKRICLAIEAIQNPGNLGTVLRTCDATGVSALFLLPNSTDPYDPVAVKASMGSIFTTPIFKLNYAQLAQITRALDDLSVIGTSDKAEQNAFTYPYSDNTLLLIGSEREGLSAQLSALCHEMVRIPMIGACDSLNLSMATGIILYEIFNQHNGLKRNHD